MIAPSLRAGTVLRAHIVSFGSVNHDESASGKPHGDELTAVMFHRTDSTPTSNDGVVPSTRAHTQHVSEVAVDPQVRGSFGTASSDVQRQVVLRIRRYGTVRRQPPIPSGPIDPGEGVYSSRLLLDASDIAVYDVLATAFTSGSCANDAFIFSSARFV
jgi:hypothetical protein